MKTFAIGDIHGAHKALLQCIERSGIDKENDVLIFLGDIVDGWPEIPECIDTLLEFKNLIAIRGNHDCYDTNTEVFTRNGWKTFITIKQSDEVLGLNKNGLAEWQSIQDIIVKNDSTLYEFESDRISMCITDKHRILHETLAGYQYSTIKDYNPNNSRFSIPLSSKSNVNSDYCISDFDLRVIAWILTDGSINKESKKLTIYQSKIKTLDIIERLLNDNKVLYVKSSRKRTTKQIQGRILKKEPLKSYTLQLDLQYSKNLVDKFNLEKDTLPAWIYNLSYRQARLFINEMILGDGTSYSSSLQHIMYGTYNFLSMVQGLCNMNGIASNLSIDTRNTYRLNMNYNLNSKLRGNFKRLEGDFVVWDLTVPLSNMLVRRNGKSYFTGNSWYMDWAKTGKIYPPWYQQGGSTTLLRYEFDRDLTIKHMNDYFNNTKIYYIDESRNYAFMHGGYDWHIPLVDNGSEDIMWDRHLIETAYMWHRFNIVNGEENVFKEFKKIFLGHTSTQHTFSKKIESTTLPVFATNVVNLDTGAGYNGVLTIMDIDSLEYWQSDNSFDLYPEYKR